jgi:hypothetical protein
MKKIFENKLLTVTFFFIIIICSCQNNKEKILGLSLPVKIVAANTYKDGGTIFVKFQDVNNETLTVYLQKKTQKIQNTANVNGKGIDGILSKNRDSSIIWKRMNNYSMNDTNLNIYDSIEFRKTYEKFFNEYTREIQLIDLRHLYVKKRISDSSYIDEFEQNGKREQHVVYLLNKYLQKEFNGKTEWELQKEWFTLFCLPEYNRSDSRAVELEKAMTVYRMLKILNLRDSTRRQIDKK